MRNRRQTRSLLAVAVLVAALTSLVGVAHGADPSWWTSRKVVDPTRHKADYAPALLGQFKWFSTNACDELEAYLPGGAGEAVRSLVRCFSNSNNYCPINLGQLKAAAANYYIRFQQQGYTIVYPWTTNTTSDDADSALATLGQVKQVFNFEIRTDSDSDGLPDWWEIRFFGSITNWNGASDPDGDGVINANEFYRGSDPANSSIYSGTLYVNWQNGNNSYDGFRQGIVGGHGPKADVNGGLNAALNGDVVEIAGGNYTNEPASFSPGSRVITLRPIGTASIIR